MQLSPIGLTLAEIDTPALLLDLDALERNIGRMALHFRDKGVSWRPHAKAFKSPAIAHLLRRAGAIGVTVAKVSEAEVMAAGGIDDILIAHLVVAPAKAARLAGLQRHANVKCTVDHPDQIPTLDNAARNAGVKIGVLVDVDLGMNRTGVVGPDAALALARQIHDSPGLKLMGVMGYEGHTLMIEDPEGKRAAIAEALGRLIAAKEALLAAGLPCPIVSAGGTGSYQISASQKGLTEIQAGGGIFACRYYTQLCGLKGHEPSISLMATVVSRPAPDRAILDIGQKSISAYRTPPVVIGYEKSEVGALSAEHAPMKLAPGDSPKIGEKVQVIPGYSDFTFVLHDRVLGHRKGIVESVWPLLGRGQLQ